LNVHRVSDVRQIEIDTAESLVPDPSPFEVEISITKLKMYKSPGCDEIPAYLIQAGGETLQSEIHELINSIWNQKHTNIKFILSVLTLVCTIIIIRRTVVAFS
jgi:hypothetical protein